MTHLYDTRHAAVTEGWPDKSGPLHDLWWEKLIDNPARRPEWVHFPRTYTFRNGYKVYKATAIHADRKAILALAALSTKGWLVALFPASDDKLTIQISSRGRSRTITYEAGETNV
jgi:hypothetical protein